MSTYRPSSIKFVHTKQAHHTGVTGFPPRTMVTLVKIELNKALVKFPDGEVCQLRVCKLY